jgi:putative tributyrin esterase
MALIHCDFYSEVLDLCTSMYVVLPQPTRAEIQKQSKSSHGYPTLYLLHGLSDDHTIWQRRTCIERYVEPLGLAVVMPAVHRSFYTDMAVGYRYWAFISEELPELARHFFPLSAAREDNFVAGLSMGGYGAFKLALTHPDRYAAAASLSGALDIVRAAKEKDEAWQAEIKRIFGNRLNIAGSGNDLFYLAEQVAKGKRAKLTLYQWCGTEDILYSANVRFHKHAQALGLDLTYEEGSGEHEWKYWDQQIQRVLAWLPLK